MRVKLMKLKVMKMSEEWEKLFSAFESAKKNAVDRGSWKEAGKLLHDWFDQWGVNDDYDRYTYAREAQNILYEIGHCGYDAIVSAIFQPDEQQKDLQGEKALQDKKALYLNLDLEDMDVSELYPTEQKELLAYLLARVDELDIKNVLCN